VVQTTNTQCWCCCCSWSWKSVVSSWSC